MYKKTVFIYTLLLCIGMQLIAQVKTHNLSIDVSIDASLQESFENNGRIFVFLTQNSKLEPKEQIWPNPYSKTHIFARNIENLSPDKDLELKGQDTWTKTPDWELNSIPEGTYYVQIVWDQDTKESRIDAPGNFFTAKQEIVIDGDKKMEFNLDQVNPVRTIKDHHLSKLVDLKSDTLSAWWGKNVSLKASVLLPHNYDKDKAYPIRYNVAGYGGRYTRIDRLVSDDDFMKWWDSKESPQIITVFLDGEGPFGDSYQMDSDNSGPYGYSLINEVIPHIEKKFRGTDEAMTRFVDGCSTGGWVSLGLQLYYPDVFNGVYSYSPDAIDFENYQLINIYKDKQAFTNEVGFVRPIMRDTNGEPLLSMKEFIAYENVFGSSDSYLNSGGQFSAPTALYSPKGDNGLPQPLFDPYTGVIDTEVAKSWEKYDFKKYAEANWSVLGPKLEGKIYIWMGDMDHFYLNPGTRGFDDFLKSTSNPKSDAIIEFTPMEGHCSLYSHKVVLLKMQERLEQLNK
jgi:S-formylglutathione hydrolase FrmB